MSIGSIAFLVSYEETDKQNVSSAYLAENKAPDLKQYAFIVLSHAEDSNDWYLHQSIPAMNLHSNNSSYLIPDVPVPKLESNFHGQIPDFVDVHPDSVDDGMFTINTGGVSIERSVSHW